jgi:Lrp/AsnC family leucine-responsive transcriptional regulator
VTEELQYLNELNSIKIDTKDREIIVLLKKEPKKYHTEIAKELQLSRQTIQKRIKYLEDNDVIRYSVLTNDYLLGKEITAFVFLEYQTPKGMAYHGIIDEKMLSRMDELEILEVHHIAGQEDVIIKIRTRNIASFEQNLIKLSRLEGVARTRSIICLTSFERNFLPKEIERMIK